MSGCARTVCHGCGIPTRNDGLCRTCLAEANAPRPCLMCGELTTCADRICGRPRACATYLSSAVAHVDRPEDDLGSGEWVPDHRGVLVWRPNDSRVEAA